MAGKQKNTVTEVAEAIRNHFGMKSIAAQSLGCDRKTIDNYIQRHPSLEQELIEARELMSDKAEPKLHERIEAGDSWAVCFYLKTRCKDRGYVERREVSGPESQPIQQETKHKFDLSKLNVKELETLLDLVSRAQPDDAGGHGPATGNGVSSTH